jgi:hypothetical protein
MVARFDHTPILQDENAVSAADGEETVRDDEGSSFFCKAPQRFEDQALSFGINRTRRLVQDEDWCILQQRAGNR